MGRAHYDFTFLYPALPAGAYSCFQNSTTFRMPFTHRGQGFDIVPIIAALITMEQGAAAFEECTLIAIDYTALIRFSTVSYREPDRAVLLCNSAAQRPVLTYEVRRCLPNLFPVPSDSDLRARLNKWIGYVGDGMLPNQLIRNGLTRHLRCTCGQERHIYLPCQLRWNPVGSPPTHYICRLRGEPKSGFPRKDEVSGVDRSASRLFYFLVS